MWFKRMIASALSAVLLCTGLGMTASAETVSTYSLIGSVSPLYEIAKNAYSELNIVGTTAECGSRAEGDNTAKITVVQTLEKYSGWFWIWNGVDGASWTKTVNSSSISFANTKSNLTGGKYRVKSVFTLTDKNGKSETITVYSSEKSI